MMGSGNMGMAYATPQVFARASAASKAAFPIATDFFDKVRLTGAAAREYEVVALALVNDAVDRSRKERIYGGADDSWRDIGASNGFKRFTKTEGTTQFYRIQGVIAAPMTNVMSMLYAERNSSIVARRNVFYGNGLDGQTLKTLRERTTTDRHQHMSLRWEAFNISTATVNYNFDASVLEYTGITLDQDREPVGFKMLHSIDIPQCKSLLQSHGLRRMDMTEVMTLRSSANTSYSEITIEGSFQVAEKISTTVLTTYLTQITHQLTKVPMQIQAHRLGAMKVLDKAQWVPPGTRKNCSVCLSRFGMMGKKHHCRACGEVICKSCVVTRPHYESEKFCKKCVVLACAEDELAIPERHDPLHTPSSSSTSSNNQRPRDILRDSYIMPVSRYSEHDDTPAFIPSAPVVPKYENNAPAFVPSAPGFTKRSQPQVTPRKNYNYVDEFKRMREDNNSMTASEASYGSTYSSSQSSLPERDESMIFLDTKSMLRSEPTTTRSYTTPPMMQHVESSLAQQRHLLKEMIFQANQASQQHSGRGYRQYPVSSEF